MKYWYREFIKFNPESYITYSLDNYIRAYKYCGNIYTFDDLYYALKNKKLIDITKAAFNKWKDKEVKDWYLWEVNVVYLAPIRMNNGRIYYISTDGVFYNSNYEELGWVGTRCDLVEIMDEGIVEQYRAGFYVMRKFIDNTYMRDYGYTRNGDYDFSNNRIDNIRSYDIEK